MFELLVNNTSLPVLESVMSFSEQRQKVLADNVANLDTPGYRACDLPVAEFQQALAAAVGRRGGSPRAGFEPRDTPHVRFGTRLRVAPVAVGGLRNYYDAGDRSVERTMTEMGKNALWHSMATELYRQQSRLLETAIRERV